MDSYDKWTPTTLQAECTRRAVDTSGTKAQLIKRVADDGFVKHKKQRQSSFDQTSDPNGRHEQAELESRAAFERNYWRVILNNDIEYFERMLAGKTKELSTKLEQVEENLKKEVGALNKRVRGYENTHLASKLGGKGGSVKKQKPKQVEKKQEPKQVEEKSATSPSIQSAASWYQPTPEQPIPQQPTSAQPVFKEVPAKEVLSEEPPNAKPATKRGRRARESTPEPAPKKKKFMTAAGAAFMKSLGNDGTSEIDYEKRVASPPPLTRGPPHTETENTAKNTAKKARLDSSNISALAPGTEPRRIESEPLTATLSHIGHIHLVCADPLKVRGDTLSYLQQEYRSFALTAVRADTTGYYLVFVQSIEGDIDLKNCYDSIYDEIEERTFFDGNVVNVKKVNRRVGRVVEQFQGLKVVHLGDVRDLPKKAPRKPRGPKAPARPKVALAAKATKK